MKVSTTKDRLKLIMKEKRLRSVDILKQSERYQEDMGVTLNKVNLSKYLNGVAEPRKKRLTLLAKTLQVSEGWLSGYDVPRDIVLSKADAISHYDKISKSDEISKDLKFVSSKYKTREDELTMLGLISNFDKLEKKDRKNLLQYSDILVESTYQTDEYNIVATMMDSSMEPIYSEGDRLMVSFGYDFQFGEVYLIEYQDKILIRKVFFESFKIILVPLNESYETLTIILPLTNYFKIIGKIIGKIKTSP